MGQQRVVSLLACVRGLWQLGLQKKRACERDGLLASALTPENLAADHS
jgi:hypothetical protein